MKINYSTKLYFGFVLTSFLTVALGFLFEYFQYFGIIRSISSRILFLVLFSLLFGTLFGYAYGLYLTRHIKRLARAVAVITRGDLRQKIEVVTRDELGELAQTFNGMVDSLTGMLTEIKNVSGAIFESAMNLSATADQMKSSTNNISDTMAGISRDAGLQAQMGTKTHAVTRDLARSTDFIAEKADVANHLSQEVSHKAQQGNDYVIAAVEKMEEVTRKMDHASRLVMGFRERTLEINQAVRQITSISQQTHLLALNASIEAARAGEHGRGFALVAEEVRKLSQETRKLAAQISQLADGINLESQQVLHSMADSNTSAATGKSVVSSASDALQEIVRMIRSSADQVQEITRLTRDQSGSATSLVDAIEEFARIAEKNAFGTREADRATREQTAVMHQLASSAEELSRTSDRLKSCISVFHYSNQ